MVLRYQCPRANQRGFATQALYRFSSLSIYEKCPRDRPRWFVQGKSNITETDVCLRVEVPTGCINREPVEPKVVVTGLTRLDEAVPRRRETRKKSYLIACCHENSHVPTCQVSADSASPRSVEPRRHNRLGGRASSAVVDVVSSPIWCNAQIGRLYQCWRGTAVV